MFEMMSAAGHMRDPELRPVRDRRIMIPVRLRVPVDADRHFKPACTHHVELLFGSGQRIGHRAFRSDLPTSLAIFATALMHKSVRSGVPSMVRSKKNALDPQSIIARLDGERLETKYQKDQVVYSQGDAADSVFYVHSGKVKVTVVSEEGKEAVVAILLPGSFCGEECLTGHTLRISTVKTLTECQLVRMAKAGIVRALHEDHEFSELFTAYLMERNIRVQEDLVDQLLNSTEKRLARLLLILANYGKEERPDPIVPKINQETLAEMIGTSRTHVNFFMNKFRQLGFIEYNGDIKVNRSLLNMLLHEKPQIAASD
jgi:CRP/FNR family cyclic AMP-dependent transcriptional regulator